MTLYLDVIWLLNWLFDCLLLYWTAVIQKRKASSWRIIIGGLIGSLIILLTFTPYHLYVDSVYMKLLFSVFMVLAVFGFSRLKVFAKNLATLYFVTFLSGGILLGLHFLFEEKIVSANPGMYQGINQFGDPVSWVFVLIGFPLAWQFSKRTLEGIQMDKLNYEQIVKVKIQVENFIYMADGFVDSGNQLYDPISRSPVMIFSIKGKEGDIPEDMLALFAKPDELLITREDHQYTWASRIRLIPFKVVGNDNQLLPAIKPDFIEIYQNNQVWNVKNGLVSFTTQQLSPDDYYQCIVHPKMMTGIPVPNAS